MLFVTRISWREGCERNTFPWIVREPYGLRTDQDKPLWGSVNFMKGLLTEWWTACGRLSPEVTAHCPLGSFFIREQGRGLRAGQQVNSELLPPLLCVQALGKRSVVLCLQPAGWGWGAVPTLWDSLSCRLPVKAATLVKCLYSSEGLDDCPHRRAGKLPQCKCGVVQWKGAEWSVAAHCGGPRCSLTAHRRRQQAVCPVLVSDAGCIWFTLSQQVWKSFLVLYLVT